MLSVIAILHRRLCICEYVIVYKCVNVEYVENIILLYIFNKQPIPPHHQAINILFHTFHRTTTVTTKIIYILYYILQNNRKQCLRVGGEVYMKILCEKQTLLDGISIVQKAVSTKSTLPILEGILIIADNDNITMIGNDLELSIQYTFPAQIINSGSIVINSKMFGDIIRKLPDAPIYIEVDENNIANIKCSNVDFDVMGLMASEFPKIPEINKEFYITLKESTLKSMLRQTVFALAVSDTKPILTGALFEIKDNILTVVSVDGYRLALRKEIIGETGRDMSTVIPGKTLNEILKITKDEDKDVHVYISDKHVLFEFEGFIVTSRVLDGEFINYQRTIPADYSLEVVADVASFCESIDRASLIINADSAKSPIRLNILGDRATINCASQMGKFTDIINIDASGSDLEIGFNYRYLLDAFKACDGENVKLKFGTALSPCIITPQEGSEFLYMVLPVRLQS